MFVIHCDVCSKKIEGPLYYNSGREWDRHETGSDIAKWARTYCSLECVVGGFRKHMAANPLIPAPGV